MLYLYKRCLNVGIQKTGTNFVYVCTYNLNYGKDNISRSK